MTDLNLMLDSCSECSPKCRSKLHQRRLLSVLTHDTHDDYFKAALMLTCQNFYRNSTDEHTGINLIHWAASTGRSSILEWLLKNFQSFFCHHINAKDIESRYTPLHRAVLYGNIVCAQVLVEVKRK